jgi:hypothetical protein
LPAEQVEGQGCQIEHQGRHQDVLGHGEDFTHQGHVVCLSQVCIFGNTISNQKCSLNVIFVLHQFGQEYQQSRKANPEYIPSQIGL